MEQLTTPPARAPLRSGLDLAAFNAMSEGVVVHSADGRIVASNPAASQILALTPDELTGRTSTDPRWRAVHEDGSPFPGETHPAMVTLATGEPQRRVLMGVHTPDGRLRWIEVNSDPVPGATDPGDPAVVATFADITEQTRLKAALVASELRYRLIAENSADVIVRVIDDVVDWVSPSLTRTFGWIPDEWIGRPPSEFIHADDIEALRAQVTQLTGGGTIRTRGRVADRIGAYHWVEGSARAVDDGAGTGSGYLVAFRDIDAELAAEELEHRARHDTLTGLLNREEATDRLSAILGDPHPDRVAVAFCDVDNFKSINDTLGHLAGDTVLQALAERIRANVRDTDQVARFGGDEILLVLVGVRDLADAERLADAVRRRVQAPITCGSDLLEVTMSIGVTLASAGEPVDAMLDRVDLAMYKAKRDGKNRVCAVPPPAGRIG